MSTNTQPGQALLSAIQQDAYNIYANYSTEIPVSTTPNPSTTFEAIQAQMMSEQGNQDPVTSPEDFTEILSPPTTQASANNVGALPTNSSAGTDVSGVDANPIATQTTLPTYAQLGQMAGTQASPQSSMLGQFETWLTSSSGNIVAVLIGLILIAGAIFSFSTVKDTVISGAKAITA